MAKQRKFVFVLGAGASLAAGAFALVNGGGKVSIPTQSDFWGTVLRFCGNRNKGVIERFLFQYFLGYARVPSRLNRHDRAALLAKIDVEEVFTFVSERVRAPSTSPQARAQMATVWKALVEAVGAAFSRFSPNASTRAIYDRLRENQFRSRDAVISFNYDTIFEHSLKKGVAWHYAGLQEEPNSLPILKPHGSINWELYDQTEISPGGRIRAKKSSADHPVVVAPTHLKFVSYTSNDRDDVDAANLAGYLDQSEDIRNVWSEMERQMKGARAIIFIGYSFPAADLYFSSILRSVLTARGSNPDVVIVNPDAISIAARLARRFNIDNVIKYFDLDQYAGANRQSVIRQLER